jgi:hypothetical protein
LRRHWLRARPRITLTNKRIRTESRDLQNTGTGTGTGAVTELTTRRGTIIRDLIKRTNTDIKEDGRRATAQISRASDGIGIDMDTVSMMRRIRPSFKLQS